MNAEISNGMIDGKYKQIVQNRGGVIDPATYESRAELNDNWFGIHEKKIKVMPDGLLHATPDFVANPAAVGDVV